ncbi:MurR/RpiR family transcriptional regulator, partial [Amedibacillus dolichus]
VSRTSTLYMLDLIYITCISLNYDDSAKRLGQTLTISK